MNPLQIAQYAEMARAVMSLVSQATANFGNVTEKVIAVQAQGRSFSDEEWKAIMLPSTQAIVDLEMTIKAMRQQQVDLATGKQS